MVAPDTNEEPLTLALGALAWTLADERRAERLLAVTGVTPMDLRERADDPVLLAAVVRFLGAHEPDLIECAGALGIPPAILMGMAERLDA